MNQTGPAAGIDAVVNLDNVIGIEQYVLEGTGDRDPFNPDPDDHSITFQGGKRRIRDGYLDRWYWRRAR